MVGHSNHACFESRSCATKEEIAAAVSENVPSVRRVFEGRLSFSNVSIAQPNEKLPLSKKRKKGRRKERKERNKVRCERRRKISHSDHPLTHETSSRHAAKFSITLNASVHVSRQRGCPANVILISKVT